MVALEERIKATETKLKQLKAHAQKIEARKRAVASKQERAADTRRKILVGAMVLEQMGKNEATQASIMGKLANYLTRADDRVLFDLPALPETTPEAQPSAVVPASAGGQIGNQLAGFPTA